MTHTTSSSNVISLQDILSHHNDLLFLHLPCSEYKPHPHQTILTWLLRHVAPKKIAIFDNTIQNTQILICSLTHILQLDSQCYGNTDHHNSTLLPETLIPLTNELPLTAFPMIYIDISSQTIKSSPLLSTMVTDIPENTLFIFNNLYHSNSFAKENRTLISKWQQTYQYCEFSHHQGLLVLYTGQASNINILNEFLSLQKRPQLEQAFKTQCALLDEYWQLKITSIQKKNENKNIKEEIIEAKTQTHLLQQKNFVDTRKHQTEILNIERKNDSESKLLKGKIDSLYLKINHIEQKHQKEIDYLVAKHQEEIAYLIAKYQEKLSYIQSLASKELQLLRSTITDIVSQNIEIYKNTYQNFSLWKQNVEEKIKSIQYTLNKHNLVNAILPKKIKRLLSFPQTPNTSFPELSIVLNNELPAFDFIALLEKETRLKPEISTIPENIISLTSEHQTHIAINNDNISSIISDPIIIESPKRPRRVIFVAGEPNTPGIIYRCERNAEACRMAGHESKVINAADVSPDDIKWADVLILWRVEFSGHILGIIDISKEYNTLTAFDADDIVFKPHFAYIEIIDGIRTIGTTEAETSRTFGNMKQTLMRTDFAVATTQEMREHMAQELIPKHAGPLVFTLPNIFDDNCVRISRFYSRIKKANKNDNYIRIGYASGTRTHQRDFALVIPALLAIFQKRPDVRLVLFREPENHRPILHMNEFPELESFQNRIEWRDTVPLKLLPQELARFDISIAPLEAENVFCNAKSELKFFEAALANVCSVVSPTGPLTRCIQHGVTGYLAKNTQEWEDYLLALIDDPALRQKMAQNAYHDVLWNFGIQRQSYLCDTILSSLIDEKEAAKAMETMIARKDYKNLSMPFIPESETLFEYDSLQESDVTVVITSYNYSDFIIEAMESVKAQTLQNIDMIIVDDGSSDNSVDLILTWINKHKNRFNRLQLLRSLTNAGLGGARNIGIAASETLYSMQLDADNRLVPDSCEKLLAKMQNTAIGYAYPYLRHFGAGDAVGGKVPFHPLRLTVGNYIDAMVMLAKWAWAAAGGYYVQRDAMGWEDYDIWCRLAELGIQGAQVTDAIAEYRAHSSSMTNTVTEQTYHKPKVTSYLAQRHPWIKLVLPEDSPWINKKKD